MGWKESRKREYFFGKCRAPKSQKLPAGKSAGSFLEWRGGLDVDDFGGGIEDFMFKEFDPFYTMWNFD